MRISDWSSDVCSSDLMSVRVAASARGADNPATARVIMTDGHAGDPAAALIIVAACRAGYPAIIVIIIACRRGRYPAVLAVIAATCRSVLALGNPVAPFVIIAEIGRAHV